MKTTDLTAIIGLLFTGGTFLIALLAFIVSVLSKI